MITLLQTTKESLFTIQLLMVKIYYLCISSFILYARYELQQGNFRGEKVFSSAEMSRWRQGRVVQWLLERMGTECFDLLICMGFLTKLNVVKGFFKHGL